MRPTFPRALVVALLALACFGCSSKYRAWRLPAPGPPVAVSPDSAVGVFERGWNDLALDDFLGLFTDDFRFVFAPGDSAGNLFRDRPLDRPEMLVILRNLFVGGGYEPPANSVYLGFDPTLVVLPDNRPGKNPGWHKQILTRVDLLIRTDAQEYRVMGNARFYVVRGDSALIPEDLGALPDTTRWYIDQWNDETLLNPGGSVARRARPARVLPAHNYTWGAVLALYR